MRIVMDAAEVASYFDVEVKYVKLWTRLGVLPGYKGPPYRYDLEDLDAWVAEGKLKTHKPVPKTEFKHEAGFWVK